MLTNEVAIDIIRLLLSQRLESDAGIAQLVEQLICNQQVGGSSPSTGSTQVHMGEFPSGQRGQTVNLLAVLSVVRIHLPPPEKRDTFRCLAFLRMGIREGGFERRLLARPRWGLATAVAFPQKSESTVRSERTDGGDTDTILSDGVFCWYGYLEGGFERRLLARPRWGLATAVAFPQKSESTVRSERTDGGDTDTILSDGVFCWYGHSEGGFERRRLATVRWTVAPCCNSGSVCVPSSDTY